ncbi:MAG: Crp/Fnr family transcriptional regulator [Oscillospiraceae bacterium]|nr:Crp/Fnr family transcriptional regulator [Oscillospiraceae bacterium]
MPCEKCENVFRESFPFWEGLSEKDKIDLMNGAGCAEFKKGQTVHDGTVCTGIIFVKTGCLRVYILSEEGKEITLYRIYAGDACVLSASCILETINFDVYVDAEEDSRCCILSPASFRYVAERRPEMKIFLLDKTVSRFSEVMWVMQQILFMSFDKRLALFLVSETEKTGSREIKLTHEQIAKYMGSAREVVSRMLKYFASEGYVELSRGGVAVTDMESLKRLTL